MPSEMNISNYGSGAQNIATGSGAQYNNNSSGIQITGSNFFGNMGMLQKAGQSVSKGHDQPSSRDDFHVAIICALPVEYDAVYLLFDQFWDEDDEPYGRAPGDTNTYMTGRIGKHDVVVALLPSMGTAAAAGAAASFRSSYSALKLALLVGICGGVPGTAEEALLGDVVISKTIQHDLGKQYPKGFITTTGVDNDLGRSNKDIRGLVATFETEAGRERLERKASQHLKGLQKAAVRRRRRCKYQYPGIAQDKLFAASYTHRHREPHSCNLCSVDTDEFCHGAAQASCSELNCDEAQLVPRERLLMKQTLEPDEVQSPEIIVGRIASGNTVMRSGEHRDKIAKEHGVIAFEMEGAGAWDEVPCIIVKGISDYADSHKNDIWRPFAAATAASVAKAMLERYSLTDKAA